MNIPSIKVISKKNGHIHQEDLTPIPPPNTFTYPHPHTFLPLPTADQGLRDAPTVFTPHPTHDVTFLISQLTTKTGRTRAGR